jgi:hypothetical protein
MNKYGLPLSTPSTQTILPVLTKDGRVHGWYPIVETTFTGAETSFTLTDIEVPVTSVTVDTDSPVKQYMAAVWDIGLPHNVKPWASGQLISPDDGYYRWWSMPTVSWFLHFGKGVFLDAMSTTLNKESAGAISPPGVPSVNSPQTLSWQASVSYSAFSGDCSFFDFNWVQLFTSSGETKPLHIEVVSLPDPIAPATTPPLLAKVIGVPVSVGAGAVMYDTIRVIKNADAIEVGAYEFEFRIYSEHGTAADVELTVNVV